MKKVLLASSISVLFAISAGCTANQAEESTAKATKMSKEIGLCSTSVNTAIMEADMSRKKAASVSGEWRDTGKFIKKAKKLAKAGDCAGANKLAAKASFEGKMGYEQAIAQKTIKMPSFFKF